ncbi:hypothetical protein [Sphingomonas sp.]|uniref:hypothetical protein n=1 Tax=Sphingomonas sp. TaxID=28214 RepID=UPI0031DDBC72
MKNVRTGAAIAIAALTGLAAAALASETVTYSYDARGRLVAVKHSGTVNNNVQANYSYDKADNRTNKTVTGAP